jgi:exopolyphosphatase/guanosine-5'-triphosphate,3'-diphosphate pyrophosphatase
MRPMTRAVIDIGTNSVKLLVAELHGPEITPLIEDSEQTRLGQGFYETHRLRADNIETTALAVARFAGLARETGAESVMAFATSAARDAVNRIELEHSIHQIAHLKLRVISGEEEADWVFRGVTSDPSFKDQHLLVMDLGGGSTEFIFGMNDRCQFGQSFQLGTVRLLEKFMPSDPPHESERRACEQFIEQFLSHEVQRPLAPHLQGKSDVQFVATGGTANILARMHKKFDSWERTLIDRSAIALDAVHEIRDALWALPLAERKRLPGLPPKRADVMLMGAAVYSAVMKVFGFDQVRVSARGLRYTALLESGER